MNIHESAEDYLEAIYMQSIKKGYVRSIDIANALNFSKPSVSVAMKHLEENGYIHRDEDRFIHLTDKGQAIASRIYERHETLAAFLMALGVCEETAYKDACKIEHDISDESFRCLRAYAQANMGSFQSEKEPQE
ncbi:MAG: metal-dependent transcriptional regulator [Oscillospiraceae bacterium]|nr:metal-dependent transcriptional regulator [Oscillospiraceae bacterium]